MLLKEIFQIGSGRYVVAFREYIYIYIWLYDDTDFDADNDTAVHMQSIINKFIDPEFSIESSDFYDMTEIVEYNPQIIIGEVDGSTLTVDYTTFFGWDFLL